MSHVTRWLWLTLLKSGLAKTGGHCPSEGGDQFFLVPRDQMINESRDSTELNNKNIYVLQIGAPLFYYKLGQMLLQIGAASLLQIGAAVVTNWGTYYKLGQPLLQNTVAIRNWGKMYYKLGQVLQFRAIITNQGIKISKLKNQTT